MDCVGKGESNERVHDADRANFFDLTCADNIRGISQIGQPGLSNQNNQYRVYYGQPLPGTAVCVYLYLKRANNYDPAAFLKYIESTRKEC
jgi:hypothetical protein